MASPQPTPFVRFSKELFEAFYMNPPDTVAACSLWLWVMRGTWGDFGKNETPEKSLSKIALEVNLGKTTTYRTLEQLVRCRRLKRGDKGGYAIQKDYDLWRKDPKPRADHWANRPQQGVLLSVPIVPTLGTEPFPRGERNRSHVGEKAVPSLGTRIRSKNTVENGEGARSARRPPVFDPLPNGKADTPRARAELGHGDFPPEDHPDFKRFAFPIQTEIADRWKQNFERERRKNACRRCKKNPKASAAWPFCRDCTVCAHCSKKPDGTRQFRVVSGEITCDACEKKT